MTCKELLSVIADDENVRIVSNKHLAGKECEGTPAHVRKYDNKVLNVFIDGTTIVIIIEEQD